MQHNSGETLTLPCFLSSVKVSARPRVGEEVDREAMGVNLLKESDEESGEGEEEEWRNPIWGFEDWRKQTPDLKAIAIGEKLWWIKQMGFGLKKRVLIYKWSGTLG